MQRMRADRRLPRVQCKDKVKYGGPGKLKQACARRKCTNLGGGSNVSFGVQLVQEGSSAIAMASRPSAADTDTTSSMPRPSIGETTANAIEGASNTPLDSSNAKKTAPSFTKNTFMRPCQNTRTLISRLYQKPPAFKLVLRRQREHIDETQGYLNAQGVVGSPARQGEGGDGRGGPRELSAFEKQLEEEHKELEIRNRWRIDDDWDDGTRKCVVGVARKALSECQSSRGQRGQSRSAQRTFVVLRARDARQGRSTARASWPPS